MILLIEYLLLPGSGMGEARRVSGCAKEWVVTA